MKFGIGEGSCCPLAAGETAELRPRTFDLSLRPRTPYDLRLWTSDLSPTTEVTGLTYDPVPKLLET